MKLIRFFTIAFMLFVTSNLVAQTKVPPAPPANGESQKSEACTNPDGTPAPGICLPINDKIIFLLIAGAVFGTYKMRLNAKIASNEQHISQ